MSSRASIVAKTLLATVLFGLVAQSQALDAAEPDWSALRALSDSDIAAMKPEPESARYWLLRTYANLDTSISEAERTLALAETLIQQGSDEAVLALALKCTIASVLYDKIEADSACQALSEQLDNIDRPIPAAIAQSQWANHLSRAGRFTAARQANLEADRLASSAADDRLVATIRNNQGVDYLIRGFSRQALTQFTSAREVAANIEDPSITHFLSVNIASASVQEGRYGEALELMQAVMQTPGYDHAAWGNFIDHVILAWAHLGLDQPQRALDILGPAFDRARSMHWGENHALALAAIGQAKYALGNPVEGAQAFKQALSLQVEYDDRTRYLETGVRHATALRAHGDLLGAKALLKRLITELETMAPSLVLVDALNERALIKTELDDGAGAAADHARADQLNTDIHGTEFDQQLALLHSSLALDAKQHQLDHLQRDAEALRLAAKSSQQQQRFVLACALLLGLIGYLLFSRRLQKRIAESRKQHNERLEVEVAQRTASLEREMTERLAIEEKQRILEEDLAESEKLRAIGQLTSGVAHDFNNLMTVMTLSAEQIQFDDSTTGAEQKKHVEDILEASASAANITSSLLSFARKQPLKSEPINLAQFVDQLLPMFQRTLG
ncbi:MAG: histidine kinase dimerization/phospho-acceptor domain-containing protein, partial [Pseudomonadales bacterium]